MTEAKSTGHWIRTNSGVLIFSIFVAVGVIFIIWSKLNDVRPQLVIAVPLILMTAYAALLAFARYLLLRDDQAGDNLYYLGFLYTLTSLGVSLRLFSTGADAGAIVSNFGIAISSTILGVAFRVIFNQMRQDPAEVERVARLELAESARRVKQELDATTFEFSSFRRGMQQSLEEAFDEIKGLSKGVVDGVLQEVKNFPERSITPIESASEKTKDAIERLSSDLAGLLNSTGRNLTAEEEHFVAVTAKVRETLLEVEKSLRAMKGPEEIIEIKLTPFIRGFTKAVNDQTEAATAQMGKLAHILSQFEATVQVLTSQLATSASWRSADQDTLRELTGKTEEMSAHLQKVLAEIEKRPVSQQERVGLFAGWRFGGTNGVQPR